MLEAESALNSTTTSQREPLAVLPVDSLSFKLLVVFGLIGLLLSSAMVGVVAVCTGGAMFGPLTGLLLFLFVVLLLLLFDFLRSLSTLLSFVVGLLLGGMLTKVHN